ncbi:MAG: hypothetical protein L0Y76_07085 [Ignavibacteria bacterium]|nr:hypothetical protein [Ignavibacteria bacterium]
MDNTEIWVMAIIAAVVIFVITLVTSVSVLHKKIVEKQVDKYEEKKNV